MNNNDLNWFDLLFNLSMSLFGGIVKLTLSDNRKRKKISNYVASAIVGGFAGLLTYLLFTNFGANWRLTSFATGVAGYMGDSILDLFSRILPNMIKSMIRVAFGVTSEDENKEQEDKFKNKKE